MSDNICIDCGKDYEYDPSRALGASSVRCVNCRKKDSAVNKKIILFTIASNNQAKCRKCGYSRSIHGFTLQDTKLPLFPPKTWEEKQEFAKSQYIICLNCEAEIKGGEAEVKIVDSKAYPVKVEFYSRNVTVVKERIQPVEIISSDVEEPEIVQDTPRELREVSRKTKRIGE